MDGDRISYDGKVNLISIKFKFKIFRKGFKLTSYALFTYFSIKVNVM